MPSEVTFSAFIVALATPAAVHFGGVADPLTGERGTPNLAAAGHAIEMLGLLQEKTKGNLASDEQGFLEQVVYELRMRYVDARKDDGPKVQLTDPD
jgi:hypothetical protein